MVVRVQDWWIVTIPVKKTQAELDAFHIYGIRFVHCGWKYTPVTFEELGFVDCEQFNFK